jgi:hypothetical protein
MIHEDACCCTNQSILQRACELYKMLQNTSPVKTPFEKLKRMIPQKRFYQGI